MACPVPPLALLLTTAAVAAGVAVADVGWAPFATALALGILVRQVSMMGGVG